MKKCCGKGCGGAKLAWVLIIIGALNWGLVGLGGFFGSNWNVVNLILGGIPVIEFIVYLLVGLAAVMALFGCKCKKCKVEGGDMKQEMGNTDNQM